MNTIPTSSVFEWIERAHIPTPPEPPIPVQETTVQIPIKIKDLFTLPKESLSQGIYGTLLLQRPPYTQPAVPGILKLADPRSHSLLYFFHNSLHGGGGPMGIVVDGKHYTHSWVIRPESIDCNDFTPNHTIKPTQKPDKVYIENPFSKPVALNSKGYIFLHTYLNHKNGFGPENINKQTERLVKSISPNIDKRFVMAGDNSAIFYDLYLSDRIKMSQYCVTHNLALIRNNAIGDCGFGALSGPDSISFPQNQTPIVTNFRLLQLFAILEFGLSNSGYLLSSIRMSEQRLPVPQIQVLKKIGELSGCLVPIMNPHMEDDKLKDPFSRNRFFVLITHEGLKKYYQSEEFKALNLQV